MHKDSVSLSKNRCANDGSSKHSFLNLAHNLEWPNDDNDDGNDNNGYYVHGISAVMLVVVSDDDDGNDNDSYS